MKRAAAIETSGILMSQRGVALLLVLWVLALLSVIAAEFCRTMRTEAAIAFNQKQLTEAYYTALGGFHLGVYQVIHKIVLYTPPKQDPKDKDEDSEEPARPWRFNTTLPEVAVGQGTARLRIDNEAGRVNLNFASRSMLRVALDGFGLSDEDRDIIADSIQDWRDEDDFHRLNGAENDYYQSLPQPYDCKNADFDTVEELLLVRGMTPEIFYGGLSQRMTVYPDRKTARESHGWRPDQEKDPNVFNFDKLNINAVSPSFLSALPGFGQRAVQAVIDYRREKDILTPSELVVVAGPDAFLATLPYLTYTYSPYYRLSALGLAGDGRARQGVGAVFRIDLYSREKYHIVQWIDQLDSDVLDVLQHAEG